MESDIKNQVNVLDDEGNPVLVDEESLAEDTADTEPAPPLNQQHRCFPAVVYTPTVKVEP